MHNQLRDILYQTNENSGSDFSGIGIIVYTDLNNIPITNLRSSTPDFNEKTLIGSLVEISSTHSAYHDGFHLISIDWKLTHVSQYFSPPIIQSLAVNRSRKIGGRYVAALYGSAIIGVEMCGIISRGFGLAIFKNGMEIYFEETT